jgi:DNA processing protein
MGIYTIQENEYPKLLKEIGKSAPKQLYYKGNWDAEIFKNCLAVVGSRRMTTYGRQVTERIVGEVAAAGVTIVSGFMYGVDAAAHRAALSVGGRTIAVMPCGIGLIHPEYQQDLYAEILSNNGLVISEYEGDTQPAYWTYPQRNRIVAGLSKAVLIIEAGEKSGSLITANLAKKFKRKLFVVPGPITSENSKGIMQLMREGAIPIGSAGDILKIFGNRISHESNIRKSDFDKSSALEQKILDRLAREPLEIDALARIFSISTSKLGGILSVMQLSGSIKQEGMKYYLNI